MKLKTIIVSAVASIIGMSGIAFAGMYTPPERLECLINDAGKLRCPDIDRNFITEYTSTGGLPVGEEVLFNFAGGVAYFTSQDEWSIFYTYADADLRKVNLRTVSTSIKPNVANGAWKKYKDEYYTCSEGYMRCTAVD